MPRQSSSSSSPSHRPSLPPPKLWHQAPPQYSAPISMPAPMSPVQVQSKTGLFQSVKEGVGLGIGSSIGHSIARSFGFGMPVTMPSPATQMSQRPEYTQCMEANKDRPQVCTPFLSKDKSPWTECMELNGYQVSTCSETR